MPPMASPIDLSHLLPDARAFLTELAANNTRDWFAAQRHRYDAELKRPAEKLLAEIALWFESETGRLPNTKLFRPHRDLRFSKDKTPYHTHLHMMWSLSDGRAWMLGIAPGYATAGAGIMTFSPAQLDRFRDAVTAPEGAHLSRLLKDFRLDEPALKRAPAPFPANHPQEGLLRRKGLVAWIDGLEDAMTQNPDAALRATFARFTPLMDWLAEIA